MDRALGQINHIECWLGKQANYTSKPLRELLEDEETTRHATLQNHAAIYFLLLAHGRGCEEFEGLCCFDLQSHSQRIHASIQNIKDQVQQLRQGEDWFENLFSNWGLSRWTSSILKTFFEIILIVSLIVLLLSCFKHFLLKLINKNRGDAAVTQPTTGLWQPNACQTLAIQWHPMG